MSNVFVVSCTGAGQSSIVGDRYFTDVEDAIEYANDHLRRSLDLLKSQYDEKYRITLIHDITYNGSIKYDFSGYVLFSVRVIRLSK